jgi:hypothetical protein
MIKKPHQTTVPLSFPWEAKQLPSQTVFQSLCGRKAKRRLYRVITSLSLSKKHFMNVVCACAERIKYLTMTDATKVWMPDTFFRSVKTMSYHESFKKIKFIFSIDNCRIPVLVNANRSDTQPKNSELAISEMTLENS